jgi:hypothetical protein
MISFLINSLTRIIIANHLLEGFGKSVWGKLLTESMLGKILHLWGVPNMNRNQSFPVNLSLEIAHALNYLNPSYRQKSKIPANSLGKIIHHIGSYLCIINIEWTWINQNMGNVEKYLNCFQKHDILVGGLEHEFYDFPSIGTHMFRG